MIDKACFVSQQEIAEHFQVNRTTIRAWTKQGCPILMRIAESLAVITSGIHCFGLQVKAILRPSDIT